MNRTTKIKALLLLNKGYSYREVSNRFDIPYWILFKDLSIYYINNNRIRKKIYFGSKKEPYYKDELKYGSIPEYKYEDLNETEKQLYNNAETNSKTIK